MPQTGSQTHAKRSRRGDHSDDHDSSNLLEQYMSSMQVMQVSYDVERQQRMRTCGRRMAQ
jgi:hypothetical protein